MSSGGNSGERRVSAGTDNDCASVAAAAGGAAPRPALVNQWMAEAKTCV